jgi:hypothetical protein
MIWVSSPAALTSSFAWPAFAPACAPFSVLTQYSWLSDFGTNPIRSSSGLPPARREHQQREQQPSHESSPPPTIIETSFSCLSLVGSASPT